MTPIIRNRVLSWTIRIVLIVLGVALIAGFAFLQGILYANKNATIQMANDGCAYSVWALRAMKGPAMRRMTLLFDSTMDSSALMLADMCLRYPGKIKRTEYNVLVAVRNYRKQFGRDPQRTAADIADGREVDKKVTEAITFMESIHDTNEWAPYKFDFDTGKVRAE